MSKKEFSPEEALKLLRVCTGACGCEGCPLEDVDCGNYNNEVIAAEAIEELLAQVKWNRVGEKLPDLDDGVVLIDGEMVAVQVLAVIAGAEKSTVLYFDGEEFFDYTGDEIIPHRVTHWRPMPEVPREEV
jgi:hypothetical protein